MDAFVIPTPGSQEGRCFWGPGDYYKFLVTGAESGGSMFAMDCVIGIGGGPPAHRHLAEDELFYVLSGAVDGDTRLVGAGESVFVPRGSAHAYVNDAESDARMIAIYTPSGMEGWFLEVCTPVSETTASPPAVTPELIERMLEAGPRYNVEWI